jgi:hypothetical protein
VYTFRIKPGESKRNRIELTLPIATNVSTVPQVQVSSCDHVTLIQGVIPNQRELRSEPHIIDGEEVWRLSSFEAWKYQQELSVGVTGLSVTVRH